MSRNFEIGMYLSKQLQQVRQSRCHDPRRRRPFYRPLTLAHSLSPAVNTISGFFTENEENNEDVPENRSRIKDGIQILATIGGGSPRMRKCALADMHDHAVAILTIPAAGEGRRTNLFQLLAKKRELRKEAKAFVRIIADLDTVRLGDLYARLKNPLDMQVAGSEGSPASAITPGSVSSEMLTFLRRGGLLKDPAFDSCVRWFATRDILSLEDLQKAVGVDGTFRAMEKEIIIPGVSHIFKQGVLAWRKTDEVATDAVGNRGDDAHEVATDPGLTPEAALHRGNDVTTSATNDETSSVGNDAALTAGNDGDLVAGNDAALVTSADEAIATGNSGATAAANDAAVRPTIGGRRKEYSVALRYCIQEHE